MSTEEQECQPELLAEEWGARLSNARENLQLSIEQVSSDLNLPQEYIRKLEQGSLEGLPSLVFAKGYIRAYSKILHLDDNQLVADFEQIHSAEGTVKGKSSIRPVSRVREQVKVNDPVMKLSSWIFILAIIGVSVWWWQTQYGGSFSLPGTSEESASLPLSVEKNENSSSAVSDSTTDVVPLKDGSAQLVLPKLDDKPLDEGLTRESIEGQGAESEAEPQYLSASEIAKLQQAVDAGVQEEASTAAVESSQPVATQRELVTEGSVSADFVAECWVSIKDADGKTLFNNLRGKGQSLSVEGKAPLSVLIGAADAVGRFSFNGKELNVAEYSDKNVVRISLPLSE